MVWSRALRKIAAMTPKKVIIRRSRPWCSSSASSAAWPVASRLPSTSLIAISGIRLPPVGRLLVDGAQQFQTQMTELQLLLIAQDSQDPLDHRVADAAATLGHALPLRGHAHDGGATVGGVGDALHQSRRLEPVNQACHVAGGYVEVPRDGVHLGARNAIVLEAHQGL